MTSGYSGTPLSKKLGFRSSVRAVLIEAPPDYRTLLGELPPDGELKLMSCLDWRALPLANTALYDLIQYFTLDQAAFVSDFLRLKAAIAQQGALWISWPKKASKVRTDMTEDVIRDTALANGLVDVKVIAVDAIWSGLKLVYRLADRT